jgi:hypothetical protein
VSYQIVLTKADKLKPAELRGCVVAATAANRQAISAALPYMQRYDERPWW